MAEDEASKAIALIQECVQILRSVDEFAPSTASTTTALDTVCLDKRFDHLLPKIRQCCGLTDDTEEQQHPTQQREWIVKSILWPLLAHLGQCYAVLDKLPPAPQNTSRQTKPPPPPGLLSIQNYTDIAVFMEFSVCTSILPLLQRNVLPCAQDRARYSLPKSLAGRIPRSSLLWGCAVIQHMTMSETILELRTTAATIARVVTLDRFRPMLLPRHVVDLYAAIFQADALEQQWKRQTAKKVAANELVPSHYNDVLQLIIPEKSSSSKKSTTTLVDPFMQARAYQTLLSRGTAAPLWLRQRVSTLLNHLACRDIGAIVHAFVRSAGEHMTSASFRLARALTSESNDAYLGGLCRQLVTLLDVPEKHQMRAPLDQNHQAGVLAAWAVIEQLPIELSLKHFFWALTRDLVPIMDDKNSSATVADSWCIHRAVRRIGILVSSLPPSCNPWKIGRLLLSPIGQACSPDKESLPGARVTVQSQLLRIASIGPAVMMRVKDDAVFALQCVVSTLVQSSFPTDNNEVSLCGEETAALALVYSMAPTMLDIQGYRYVISAECEDESDGLEVVVLEQQREAATLDVSSMASGMEKLAKIVVEDVLLNTTKQTDETKQANEVTRDTDKDDRARLPSALFHLLLLCYFSSASVSSATPRDRVGLPSVFRGIHAYIQVAVMILLPYVCDKCSPETLLLTDGSGAGILATMSLILDCTRSVHEDPSDANGNHVDSILTVTKEDVEPFHLSDNFLLEALSLRDEESDLNEDDLDLPMDETLISTCSVVLTILVTMLELGNEKRSDKEEKILTSMLPSLGTLASVRDRDFRVGTETIMIQSGLAEMAAHAMALIAARSQIPQAPSASSHEACDRPKQKSLHDSISEAERDLESEHPPIRARGVALVTRISHRFRQEKENRLRKRPMIMIVDDDGNDEESDDTDLGFVLKEIIRISIGALADKESYVYLAAVQSLVAIADADPREVVPIIGRAICSGTMSSARQAEASAETKEIGLTVEQRIKLTEALLFTIRRRGEAVSSFVPLLMNLFLYGLSEESVPDSASEMDSRLIQEKTHRYFVQGSDSHQDDEATSPSREELDLRIRTGGPVFQTEENDVLRAGCIAVLSELISSAAQSSVARHCFSLMHFATNSLNLEASRPVRRATALLCCELYRAVLREQDQDDNLENDVARSLAVEIVSSGEEELYSALGRCMDTNETSSSTSKLRLYDPATAERCKEALQARAEAESSGVFAAAKLYVVSTNQENSSRAADIIRARLKEGNERSGSETVTAMKGLKVDRNSLMFE